MSTILLDTNVASLLHPKKRDAPERPLYAQYIDDNVSAVSFQTAAELYAWASRNNWGAQAKASLDIVITRLVVLPPDDQLLRTWADVMVAAERSGRRLEAPDAWVAATAVRHGIPLLTHDADLVGLPIPGLTVITRLT